jgi:Na+/glutamate symporter
MMASLIVPTWKLGAVQVLALGCLGVAIGSWLKKKLPVLDRLCIPTSIVGGMLFALAAADYEVVPNPVAMANDHKVAFGLSGVYL